MLEFMKKCLVEFIGTFFLVLTVGFAAFGGNEGVIPAIAIGFILMVMVYAGGHVSGGHYNPAVSLAAAFRGVLPWDDFFAYIVSQITGGILASLIVGMFVHPDASLGDSFTIGAVILGEFLFTFVLCYVVLHVATSVDNENNSFYGLAIGSSVTVGIFAVSSLCFAAFNPAVAFGIFAIGAMSGKILLSTILANFVGGAVAALAYKVTNNDEE